MVLADTGSSPLLPVLVIVLTVCVIAALLPGVVWAVLAYKALRENSGTTRILRRFQRRTKHQIKRGKRSTEGGGGRRG